MHTVGGALQLYPRDSSGQVSGETGVVQSGRMETPGSLRTTPPYTAVAFYADQFPLLRISRALTAQLSFLYCAIDVRSNGTSVSLAAKVFHQLGSTHARCEPGSKYTGRTHTNGFSIDQAGN